MVITMLNKVNRGVLLLAIGQTIVWAGLLYSFPALLLRWENDLGWSKPQLTGAITLALLCSALCSPLAGRIIDRGFGPHLMAGCGLVGAVALFALSYIETLWQFYLLWGLIGSTLSGCLYEPCFALITRAFGQRARQSILLITLIAGFASTLSFPGAHALADQYGWRFTVQCFAVIVLLTGVPALWFGAFRVESQVQETQKAKVLEWRSVPQLLTPVFMYLALAFGLLAMVHGVTIHHLLHILIDRGLTLGTAVVIASLIGPMQVAGRLAMLAINDHASNFAIANACFVALTLSIVLLLAVSQYAVLAFGFVLLFGAGYGMVSVIRPVVAREVLGTADFGLKTGLLAFFYLVGSATAPYVGSVIWSFGGYNLVLSAQIGLALAGLVFFRLITLILKSNKVGSH